MKDKKRKTKFGVALGAIAIAFLGAIIGVGVYRLNAFANGNRLPMPFGVGSAVVQSGSMEPAFSKGDLLFLKATDELAVGDIIVFKSGNVLVVHRIVAIDGDSITTKGDANNAADTPVSREDVKGKVTAVIPSVGVAVEAIRSPVGIICTLAITFILLLMSFKSSGRGDETTEELRAELKRLREEADSDKDYDAGEA